ncbi:MAG TPA: hypothetical protein VIL46_03990 [Gemmataceae bacterium]
MPPFGRGSFSGALAVIGRKAHLEPDERERLEWRCEKVRVGTSSTLCLTFEDLYEHFELKLQLFEAKGPGT